MKQRGSTRTCASTKWPMRTLAMTGMVTVSTICLIILGSLYDAVSTVVCGSEGARRIAAHHPSNTASRSNICRYTLERHNGTRLYMYVSVVQSYGG